MFLPFINLVNAVCGTHTSHLLLKTTRICRWWW